MQGCMDGRTLPHALALHMQDWLDGFRSTVSGLQPCLVAKKGMCMQYVQRYQRSGLSPEPLVANKGIRQPASMCMEYVQRASAVRAEP